VAQRLHHGTMQRVQKMWPHRSCTVAAATKSSASSWQMEQNIFFRRGKIRAELLFLRACFFLREIRGTLFAVVRAAIYSRKEFQKKVFLLLF
jgi:hypothetical protein